MDYFGLTDRGRVRPTNQDIYRIEAQDDRALLVVCDGMGGANAGNVASRFAADTFIEVAKPALERDMDAAERQKLLLDALEQANQTVFTLANRQPEFEGMGTTLVAALIQGQQATVLNVGDSRAYLFEDGAFQQLTLDHSYVEELRRRGKITDEEAKNHPQRNLITRAVGVELTVEGDIFEGELSENARLLLCSDGLSGMVDDSEIENALRDCGTVSAAGGVLMRLALEAGGKDNITVALFTRAVREEA